MSGFDKWAAGYPDQNSLRTFKVGDHIATPDAQLVLETESYKMARDSEKYDAGFDKWMQSVDWSVIDKMVQELVDKSAVKGKTINNIWPGRIVNENDDPNSIGGFEMNGNYIALNNEFIDRIAAAANVDADVMRTQMLFHEVVHAASKHENQVSYKSYKTLSDIIKEVFLKDFSVFRKASTETLVSSGNYVSFEQKIHRDKNGDTVEEEGPEEFFSFFDDAIVEKMSIEMLRDYAVRSGKFTKEQLAEYEEKYLQNEKLNPGIVYSIFMDAVVDVLATYNKVDKQTVWQAFKRGQFNEKPFEDEGVKEMFAGAFYPNFLKDLSETVTSEDALRLILKAIEKIKSK